MLPYHWLLLFVVVSGNSFQDQMKNSALFVREARDNSKKTRQVPEPPAFGSDEDMDKTVNTILAWLQDRYTNSNRIARQGLARDYLPSFQASTTQQPRPFQQTSFTEKGGYQTPRPGHSQGFSTANLPQEPQDGAHQITENAPPARPNLGHLQLNYPLATPPSQKPYQPPLPSGTTATGTGSPGGNRIDDELNHPPHIHNIQVQCGKESMTINIEFNRPFNGVIYSKGYYANPECRYVATNSGKSAYSFTVMINSCGTQFIDQFNEGKQAYLENILVLQNEPGIQEVWDTVRSVRCQWEGSISKALSVALSVGTLSQEVVTFSGDTATARLDIQVGRGPYAPSANGLVKIGETMTLVVTVEGDPAFSILVRECQARDNDPNSGNVVKLTDNRGCVLRPKLMGAFQTTTDQNSGSVIAFAYFQAFKFPDVMDLIIECNVELCKANCQPCADPNQNTEPGRRRKRWVSNSTETDPILLGKRLMVFLPQDIESPNGSAGFLDLAQEEINRDAICVSAGVFIASTSIVLVVLLVTSMVASTFWLKNQRRSNSKC